MVRRMKDLAKTLSSSIGFGVKMVEQCGSTLKSRFPVPTLLPLEGKSIWKTRLCNVQGTRKSIMWWRAPSTWGSHPAQYMKGAKSIEMTGGKRTPEVTS